MLRCGSCTHKVVPIVAIDVDGTISEYHRAIAAHTRRYYGMPESSLDWNGKGNFEDFIGVSQAQYRDAKLAYRQGGFKRWSDPIDGLEDLVKLLRQLRFSGEIEVWVTTTRPWMRLDSTDPDTRFWLDKNFPVYDALLYDEDKYQRLAEIVDPGRVVAVIDDLPEMVLQARAYFPRAAVYMSEMPHTREQHPSFIRASLRDFRLALPACVDRWHDDNKR